MLDKEGIGKCESVGLKKCEACYMYIRLIFVAVLCFPIRHNAGA